MKHLDAFDRYIPNRQSRQKYKQMSVNPNDRHVFGIIQLRDFISNEIEQDSCTNQLNI